MIDQSLLESFHCSTGGVDTRVLGVCGGVVRAGGGGGLKQERSFTDTTENR